MDYNNEQDRLHLIYAIKAKKNELASLLKKLPNIKNPYQKANSIFGWELFPAIYGRTFDEVRKELGVKKDFNFVELLDVIHLETLLLAIENFNKNALNHPYAIGESAVSVGKALKINLAKLVDEKSNKTRTVYQDLLFTIKENIKTKEKKKQQSKKEQATSFDDSITSTYAFSSVIEEASSRYRDTNLSQEEISDFYEENPDYLLPDFEESEAYIKHKRK